MEEHDHYPDSVEPIISGDLIDNVTLCSLIVSIEKNVPIVV